MCEPVTMATLAIAQTGARLWGARESAKDQYKAYASQRSAQSEQIADSASIRAGERVKQMRAEQARMRVSAGEAGIAGNSFEAMLMDTAFQSDQDVALIGKDAANADRASHTRFLSANAQVANPGALESGLALGAAAYGGWQTGQGLLIPESTLPTAPKAPGIP